LVYLPFLGLDIINFILVFGFGLFVAFPTVLALPALPAHSFPVCCIGGEGHARIDIPLKRRKNRNDVMVFFCMGFGPCQYIIGSKRAVKATEERKELKFGDR
jgi:hypothetical protein